ncbi:unnamed protein product [Clonostachys solani]|uniref:Ribosomal RNA-processing protein 15 n=1 Tax=Clonostachys solani TaxID=160281 RepID=A0A9N9ZP36_9HYPO|nr:unnamed protein product [Clonostachys solani]
MAGPYNKKRSIDGRAQRPYKKQKRKQRYHSESEDEATGDFDPVNLLDSDDDIHNAKVDDVGDAEEEASSSEDEKPATREKKTLNTKKAQKPPAKKAKDAPSSDEDEEEEEEDDEESSDIGDEDDEYEIEGDDNLEKKSKSKRNDPTAFATSLSKILSTKLSTTKRADPVLARSTDAVEASKAVLDNALEAKARKQMRDQKRKALEKGRVKDVLVATKNESTGEFETTTSEIMETERRLRKVAQRGVVKLFNAVRAAQVAAVEADKGVKKQGVIGMNQREEKVNELSKKGFLDLIASGGGGLKKTALEEA